MFLSKIKELNNFKTIFLESADEFIQTLDKKTYKKLFQNIRIAEQANNPKFFKKLIKIFGNLELGFLINKSVYSLFGTKEIKEIL